MKAERMRAAALFVSTVVIASGCASRGSTAREPILPSSVLVRALPASVGLAAALEATLDSLVMNGLSAGAAPGAALAVGRHGRLVHLRGYGRVDTAASATAVTDSTRFDLASLTKVVATTTAAMILEEEGRLELDRPVSAYLPELDAADKAGITLGHLLRHNGGFRSGMRLWKDGGGAAAFLRRMNDEPLAYTPGDSTIYSDWDLILTGWIVERIAGKRLDVFLRERVWEPLGMRDTGFNPLASDVVPAGADCTATLRPDHPLLAHVAATEVDTVYRHRLIHGIVHDENACSLGGVAGHAGLFSSARDLAVFAQMMLNGGQYGGARIVGQNSIARWTARQGARSSRALGWDTPAPRSTGGRYFSPRSFGHTGFTGTSMWLDPERGIFVVLLTNRVNPTRANTRHEPLRRAIADAVQQAVLDAPLIEWQRVH